MDLQDNPGLLDLLDHRDCRLTLMNVTSRKELLAHLDPLGYKGNWDRKVTKEIPVFSVKVLAPLDYLAHRALKESGDLPGEWVAKEKRVSLD